MCLYDPLRRWLDAGARPGELTLDPDPTYERYPGRSRYEDQPALELLAKLTAGAPVTDPTVFRRGQDAARLVDLIVDLSARLDVLNGPQRRELDRFVGAAITLHATVTTSEDRDLVSAADEIAAEAEDLAFPLVERAAATLTLPDRAAAVRWFVGRYLDELADYASSDEAFEEAVTYAHDGDGDPPSWPSTLAVELRAALAGLAASVAATQTAWVVLRGYDRIRAIKARRTLTVGEGRYVLAEIPVDRADGDPPLDPPLAERLVADPELAERAFALYDPADDGLCADLAEIVATFDQLGTLDLPVAV